MKPVLYLRIASILTLIHSILHTIGGVFGKPPSAQAAMIAASMRYRFEVLGVMRSYADFYRGMGLGITIALTMDAAALWVLASMAKSDSARLRPIIAVFCFGYIAFTLNSLAFFFAELIVAPIWSVPMDIAPRYAGSASGMMNFGFGVAGLVSPSSFGYLVDRTGSWILPFIGSIVLLLLGAVLASRLRPDKRFTGHESA